MRLHASLLQYTGNVAEAAALARRTQQVLEANGLSISSTAAHSLRLLAVNKAIAGEYPGRRDQRGGDTRLRAGHPGNGRPRQTLLNQGYYLLNSNRVDAALESFRKAGVILRSLTGTGIARRKQLLPGSMLFIPHRATARSSPPRCLKWRNSLVPGAPRKTSLRHRTADLGRPEGCRGDPDL